jgi:hypothetical protein
LGGHPATDAPLAERIGDGVQMAWRFFHKNLPFDESHETPIVEQSLGDIAPVNRTLVCCGRWFREMNRRGRLPPNG